MDDVGPTVDVGVTVCVTVGEVKYVVVGDDVGAIVTMMGTEGVGVKVDKEFEFVLTEGDVDGKDGGGKVDKGVMVLLLLFLF